MDDVVRDHRTAVEGFGRRVHAVGAGQWGRPTPCADWDVRTLVGHLVDEQLWVPPLLAGETIGEVGDRFAGDQLGDDPVGAWDRAVAASLAAVAEPGALGRTVHLSYGERPAVHYVQEMTMDALVHSWDLARGIGADESLDADLVATVLAQIEPRADELAASGLFDPPVEVPPGADPRTRLLALTGRRA